MPARPALLALTPVAASMLAALTACSGGSVKQTVGVTMSADGCDLGSTTLDAGKTAFEVKNSSGKEAEAYVYDADGSKVDEVEGIADGTSRTLTVSLDAGKYEFACKPEGDDVRTSFTVG
jgi:iron uptake system component EfeO